LQIKNSVLHEIIGAGSDRTKKAYC
jgi:hypothetical protein